MEPVYLQILPKSNEYALVFDVLPGIVPAFGLCLATFSYSVSGLWMASRFSKPDPSAGRYRGLNKLGRYGEPFLLLSLELDTLKRYKFYPDSIDSRSTADKRQARFRISFRI